MKVAFVHLSDFHFKNRENSLGPKAQAVMRCLRASVGQSDIHPVVVITGDLGFSGRDAEYVPMADFIRLLLEAASKEFGHKAGLAVVPGNHDVDDPYRTLSELKEFMSAYQGQLDDFYRDELAKSHAFFDFAKQFGLEFDAESGTCVTTIRLNEGAETASLRIVGLSSSPCSTRDSEQGRHYLPESAIRSIRTDGCPGALSPYTVVLMHHPEHWYDDTTRLRLEHVLKSGADFLFTGHEHMDDASTRSSYDDSSLVVSRAGEFARDDWMRCSFSCVLLDTTSHKATVKRFGWNPTEQLFARSSEDTTSTVVFPKGAALHPRNTFVKEVSKSEDAFFGESFLDFFQFPALTTDDTFKEVMADRQEILAEPTALDEEDIFSYMSSSKVVSIVGDKNSGRTTLLKYIYLKALERGYSPVYLKREASHGTFAVTFSSIVRNQYGDSDASLEAYRQQDTSRKVLFVDDFHLLNRKAGDVPWLAEALQSVAKVVIATDRPLALGDDSREGVLTFTSEISTLRLGSFTKSSRDALIGRICKSQGIGIDLAEEMAITITRTVSEYHYMFPLNPGFTLQYLRYALEKADAGEILLRCEKPFGEVYQNNIESVLARNSPASTARYSTTDWKQIAIATLGKLAYFMHSARRDSLSREQAITVIRDYLDEYALSGIDPNAIFDSLRSSGIIEPGDDGKYHFRNSNHLAFFIAYDISARLEYNAYQDMSPKEDVERILDEVGYGINETIVMFLSYLKQSVFIPLEISARGAKLVANAVEATDLSFVPQDRPITIAMPGDDDRKAANRLTDGVEARQSQDSTFSYRGLYDYQVAEPTTVASIPLSAKYLELAGRVMSASFVRTRGDDKETIVSEMYETLGKAVGLIDNEFASYTDEIVDAIIDSWQSPQTEMRLSREKARILYSGFLLALSIGLISQVANSMPDDNVIDYVCAYKAKTRLQKLFQLVMLANHSDHRRFCDLAGSLMRDAQKHGKYADSFVIAFTTSQFIIGHPSLRVNLHDKLADEVFSGKKKEVKASTIIGYTKMSTNR